MRPRFKAAHDIYRQTGRISQLDRTRLVSGRIESGLFSVVECQWASALPYLWNTHSCCLQLNMFHFHCRNVTQIISPVIVGSEWSEIRAKRLAALFNIRSIHSRVRYDTMDSETNSQFENRKTIDENTKGFAVTGGGWTSRHFTLIFQHLSPFCRSIMIALVTYKI